MTQRLYYTDPSLQAFDAEIVRVEARDGRLVVTLDRTAFYPTSGGQSFDTGTLGGFPVVDVLDAEDGTIAHVLSAEPRTNPEPGIVNLEPGRPVRGVIDWARRIDHMQQHTGQHVLSAAFARLFDVGTVSVHLGSSASTIDLARELTPAEVAAGETEANRIVFEDRPVSIRFASAEEASRMPLRKEPARAGTLRLIDVEGFDLSACGGTHVARTGGVGLIVIASWERFKGGQRIEFLCGGRALARFRALRETVGATVRLLSVLPEDLPASVERFQTEAREQKRALAALQMELARFRADELASSAESVRLKPDTAGLKGTPDTSDREAVPSGARPIEQGPHARLVLRALDSDVNGLKTLASAVVARPGYLVVLVSTVRPALVVVARSSDVTTAAQRVIASLTSAFGGRGGGKPEFAQGGGLDAPAEAILDAARRLIVTDS
jgi:alanyl-tRNA synthetase